MVRWISTCVLLSGLTSVAQSTPPASAAAYDLISTVKPNHSADVRLRIRMDANEIFIEDATLADLLANTYGVRNTLIVQLPKWAESERFDVRAKVLSDDENFLAHVTRVQRRQIFERMLKERFGVVTHTETRTLPIYELVHVGSGPELVENPPPAPGSAPETLKPGRNGRGNTSVMGTHLDATGVRIGDLCANLARVLDRSVVDKTGLMSFYDITLNWSDAAGDEATNDAPSLFAALKEQLGLKLEPAKGPVTVLVVDQASQPKAEDQ